MSEFLCWLRTNHRPDRYADLETRDMVCACGKHRLVETSKWWDVGPTNL